MTPSLHPREEEALLTLRKDIILLLAEQPFFGHMLAQVRKEVSLDVPVAGVSLTRGTFFLFIHPDGYLSYSRSDRLFILIHEMIHLIFHHFARSEGMDPTLWNIAADIAINQLIPASYATFPADALTIRSFESTRGLVLPPKLALEDYYRLLLAQKEPLPMPEAMKNSPYGQGAQKPGSPSSSGPQALRAPDFQGLHPTWNSAEHTPADLSQRLVRQFVKESAERAQGHLPKGLDEVIQPLLHTPQNWRDALRNLLARQRKHRRRPTWKKRNRRLGSKAMGHTRGTRLVVAAAIDTSASLSASELSLFLSELEHLSRLGYDVIIIECDAAIHKAPYRFQKGASYALRGRGGTDFRPVCDLLLSRRDPLLRQLPDVVLFFTDGHGPAPDSFPIPAIWCLTPGGTRPVRAHSAEKVPWGATVFLRS